MLMDLGPSLVVGIPRWGPVFEYKFLHAFLLFLVRACVWGAHVLVVFVRARARARAWWCSCACAGGCLETNSQKYGQHLDFEKSFNKYKVR